MADHTRTVGNSRPKGEGRKPAADARKTADWLAVKKREFHGMTDRAKKHSPEILTREEVLELLSSKAAAGSVTAMVCLERTLRHERVVDFDDELERAIYGSHEARKSGDPS